MLLPKRAISAIIGVFVFLSVISLTSNIVNSRLNPLYWLALTMATQQEVQTPLTTHIVLLQFKAGASSTAVKEVTAKFLGLKKACRHPDTKSPYIVSLTGGRDNSKEKLQNGMTHAFILQFRSSEDRDYYVEHDPAHQAFKNAADPVIEKAVVVDFLTGVFT